MLYPKSSFAWFSFQNNPYYTLGPVPASQFNLWQKQGALSLLGSLPQGLNSMSLIYEVLRKTKWTLAASIEIKSK